MKTDGVISEIAYIDESYDESHFAISALIIPTARWRDCFNAVKDYRQALKREVGIFTSKELHATEFVSGHGRIAPKVIHKGLRCEIYHQTISMIAGLPVCVISGCWPRSGSAWRTMHASSFRKLQDRLQKRCTSGEGHLIRIVDQGKEKELTKVARRAALFNPVGSRYGTWGNGARSKNIPTDRLIEDPIFRSSEASYFLQLADFVAFALLKSESPPTDRVIRYSLDTAYDRLEPVVAKEASRKDPRKLGIVRS